MPEDHVHVSHELGASFTWGSLERELNNRLQNNKNNNNEKRRVRVRIVSV